MAPVLRSIPLLPLILASCAVVTGSGSGSGVLNYAQVNSLRTGMAIDEVVRQFGEPRSRHEFDDGSTAIAYRAENARGEVGELRIAFGETGLSRWTLAPRK